MALTSPGVQVSVSDESQYLPAPTNSIPFILLATAENKANPNGTGVATGTTSANAGKLFQITSQRDLVTLYGNPFFYSTSSGTPIQGYELNEYGLLAAYSALGVTNRVYCLRADIDLASLVGQTGRPSGNPQSGAYWLDTTTSTWGINEFDAVTGTFTLKTPIVITESALVSGGLPASSVGNIGDYAVIAIPTYAFATSTTAGEFFYKNSSNVWVRLGSAEWMASWPIVACSNSVSGALPTGDVVTIQVSGGAIATFTIGSGDTVQDLVNDINNFYSHGNLQDVVASVTGGKLQLFSRQVAGEIANQTPRSITIAQGSGDTVLDVLGITAGTYYQPTLAYGTSAQQPLWQAGQTYARPSGSVWIKVGAAGSGLNSVISQWSSTTSNWIPKTVSYATSDWAASAALDSTGGKNIPAGTVYAQYAFNQEVVNNYQQGYVSAPVYYWERITEGPTVVTGTTASPTFTAGTLYVKVTVPGSTTLSGEYSVTITGGDDAADFVTAWNTAAIPYTTAAVTASGAIQLTHVAGGTIVLDDFNRTGLNKGFSSGIIAAAGMVAGSTTGVKYGSSIINTFTTGQGPSYAGSTTSGVGSGLVLDISSSYGQYYFDTNTFTNPGGGYQIGDTITLLGTALGGTAPANNLTMVVTSVDGGNGNAITGLLPLSGTAATAFSVQLSNWIEFDMTANEGALVASPANLTNWFYSVIDEADIMVNTSTGWKGYGMVDYDSNGFPLPSGTNETDPNGPIVSATEPSVQSDGTALVYGDIWIDTSDLENYPVINRWQNVGGVDSWTRINNSDQTSSSGILFADARWATNGTINPVNDPIPTITSLLDSDYTDLDAPQSSLYPVGMLLFNTRRSGYNVKQFRSNYFNGNSFPDQVLPTAKDAWVSISGNQSNGSPYMGRKAQRSVIVEAMRAAIDSNTAARDEDNAFNLLAAPNYPELQPNMVVLNNDRDSTGFIIGDTPMRLADDATAIQAWATNAAGASSTGEDGLVTRDTYMGLFYPSGMSNDLSGNLVAVPASHMMIRTILRNDSIAYPWFAPAGTRRGVIDNATSIGYLDAEGEFVSIKTRIGVRDVLYENQINPLVFFTGNGLLNYGNKTCFSQTGSGQSALDRINVARLIAYIRRQLTLAARPFVFEPNDAITRQQISAVIQTMLVDLVAKRGVADYLVVCDTSNNTPARIDRNELWVDIAIEPVKSAEFIYIPVRVFNTGEISSIR